MQKLIQDVHHPLKQLCIIGANGTTQKIVSEIFRKLQSDKFSAILYETGAK